MYIAEYVVSLQQQAARTLCPSACLLLHVRSCPVLASSTRRAAGTCMHTYSTLLEFHPGCWADHHVRMYVNATSETALHCCVKVFIIMYVHGTYVHFLRTLTLL